MIEKQIAYITKAKNQSKEEFVEEYGNENLWLWECLQKAKSGNIVITKTSSNFGYLSQGGTEHGYTPAFGVGLPCYIDRTDSYYYTSNIESINWEDKTFKTKNSTYKFEFNESQN